ncbi:poly(A) RNA polymerase GLD2-like [Saccoglossus kowalevskii]|uniref:Poly(A) RNA polymerase gld-2 homolog A-like n=1 Tax=Saccoglossus kowalevskii TaxID=10224 RepID=A0ABM0GLR6_SACKO|nr:PREDICTED: poly(A) RNA polymerase gld-2 homolog A-like [Saccoglossus kowalevskii]
MNYYTMFGRNQMSGNELLQWNQAYLDGLKVIDRSLQHNRPTTHYLQNASRSVMNLPLHTPQNTIRSLFGPQLHSSPVLTAQALARIQGTGTSSSTSQGFNISPSARKFNSVKHAVENTVLSQQSTSTVSRSKRKRSLDEEPEQDHGEKKQKTPGEDRRRQHDSNLLSQGKRKSDAPVVSQNRRSLPNGQTKMSRTASSYSAVQTHFDSRRNSTGDIGVAFNHLQTQQILLVRPLRLDQPPSYMDKFSQEIWNFYLQNRQTPSDLAQKIELRNKLFRCVSIALPAYSSGLHITGSTLNGFGTKQSDLDMCLMVSLPQSSPPKTLILRLLHRIMRQIQQDIPSCKSLLVIRARVPILRFTDTKSGFDCDININNATGIRNTHLLQAYSKCDWRVAPLMLTIKQWASANNINDASQSTLSSYTLALMVLHYLQVGCNPAVLPALQQLHPYYFRSDSDVKNLFPQNSLETDLPDHLRYRSQNTQSLAGLLRGFFYYYVNVYKFAQQVISIRLGITYPKQSLTSVHDLYNWKYICIEEPFDSNNTARPVHLESKYLEIIQAFSNTFKKIKKATSTSDIFQIC